MSFLDGKKTYILGIAALVTVFGYHFGIVDANLANELLTLFGFGGLITLRAAINKV